MKRKIYYTLLILSFLLIFSCVSTDVYTIVDENLISADKTSFLVQANLQDKKLNLALEEAFATSLEEQGFICLLYDELFPPINDYDYDHVKSIIDERGIEIVITVDLLDSDSDVRIGGGYTTGVYSVTELIAFYEVTFYDWGLDKNVLVTQVRSSSDTLGWKGINAAAARKAVSEYIKYISN